MTKKTETFHAPRPMLRKLARRVSLLLVGLAVIGGILYAAGLRIVQYGGGGIGFAFTKSLEKRAAEIEKHREAQRAQAPLPFVTLNTAGSSSLRAGRFANRGEVLASSGQGVDLLDQLSWIRS